MHFGGAICQEGDGVHHLARPFEGDLELLACDYRVCGQGFYEH